MRLSDHDLLRQYAHGGSQTAFAALVARHLNLVFSGARRQVRSPELAEEVAQSVFIDLARNAATLKPATPLPAWLHLVTRRTAIDVIRRESRRQAREHQAAEIAAMKTRPSDWDAVEPLLDEAVESLGETDRAAILLRYFENKSLREVGATLGASEDAAQKRVRRAVEQLRAFFLRRGITVTAAGLVTDLSAHALQSAPAALGTTIASAVANTVSPAALTAAAAIFTMTAAQKAILAGILAIGLGSVGLEAILLRGRTEELASLRRGNASLAAQIRDTRQQQQFALQRRDEVNQQAGKLAARPAAPPVDPALETQLVAWLQRAAQLNQLRDARADLAIPEFQFLPNDKWFEAARTARLESDEDIRKIFADLRLQAEHGFVAPLQRALGEYLSVHGGTLPARATELAAYFHPPLDPSTLERYEMMASGNVADLPSRRMTVVTQRSPRDLERDRSWEIGTAGWSYGSALFYWAKEAAGEYAKANGGARPTDPAQLLPYISAPVDVEKLRPFMPALATRP